MSRRNETSNRTREGVAREAWSVLYRFLTEGEGQRRFHTACAATGLPPGALKTLLLLDTGAALPMRDLAGAFQCDPSYVTSLVDILEKAGFVVRRPHAVDRRVKEIVLTADGAQALEESRSILLEPPEALGALTLSELRQLRDLLAKVAGAKTHVPDAAGRPV